MEKQSDVLVIGGGVIGLACAYYLAKAGKNVRVLERETIGAGASAGNCGLIFTSHLVPLCAPGTIRHELRRMFRRSSPLYIQPTLDTGRLFWFLNFARKCTSDHMAHAIQARAHILQQSKKLYQKLFKEERLECDREEKGVLMVFKSPSEMQKYSQINRRLKPFGLEAVFLAGEDLFRHEPALRKDICGAWYHKTDSHLRPDKLLPAWQQTLLKMGVVFEENCCLETLVAENRRIHHAETTGGVYTAEAYVLATGAWTPRLTRRLKLNIPVQPGKGYSLTMSRPAVCPEMPCYFYEKSVVATPWESGFRLGGTMEFSGLNSIIRAARINNLASAAKEYLKEPIGEPATEEWVGMRPMVYDDLPIIDRAPHQANLVVATGHGMSGISMATSTGKLVAEIITGRKPHIDPTAFGVHRFH
jgi:D-amino-acid dehydrogenase